MEFLSLMKVLARNGVYLYSYKKDYYCHQTLFNMYYRRRYSGTITELREHEIFVFNSYSNGINKFGTAKAALTYHGAKLGVGEGPTGQSYAIPSEIPLDQMQMAVDRFIEYAKNHPGLEFLVTPIGIGKIFKRDVKEMANLFANAMPVGNIILPREFVDILEDKFTTEKLNHIDEDDPRPVNYKLIRHDDCEFDDSAVMKQDNGKYTLLQLSNMSRGGGWSGFDYLDSMQDFDHVLMAVVPSEGIKKYWASQMLQSCVIVSKNGLWGSICTRFEFNFSEVVPIKYLSEDYVIDILQRLFDVDELFIWKTYEDYTTCDELESHRQFISSINDKVKIFVGDITKLHVDAIVNAANSTLLGGGGIDGAIHRTAGPQLLEECRKLGGCNVGESKITNAYNLPCKKIIHTVGPYYRVIRDINKASELLRSCYYSVLDIAMENNLKSVAFCCISTGIFGFPRDIAAKIALEAIYSHPYYGDVQICCYTEEDKSFYDSILEQ